MRSFKLAEATLGFCVAQLNHKIGCVSKFEKYDTQRIFGKICLRRHIGQTGVVEHRLWKTYQENGRCEVKNIALLQNAENSQGDRASSGA